MNFLFEKKKKLLLPVYKLAKPALPDGGRGLDVVTGGCGPSVIGGLVVTLKFKICQF